MYRRTRDVIRESFDEGSIFTMTVYLSVGISTAVLIELFDRYFADSGGWLAVGLAAFGLVAARVRRAWIDQREKKEQSLVDPHERLGTRIDAVNKAFADAATLMEELQRHLAAQEAARRRLVAEAEHQQQLIGMDREEAEAVRRLILGETRADIARQRRDQWLFFVLGVAVSIPVGVAINVLFP
ncbi:hypothetical protein [Nonomuraea candida]|uniref:hypothetical protein n=1 Tax=Nonomuraea candida TaxID=359159 RepID=UPI0005BD9A53|nr:hypothetical protein [Nonomuraea candida]